MSEGLLLRSPAAPPAGRALGVRRRCSSAASRSTLPAPPRAAASSSRLPRTEAPLSRPAYLRGVQWEGRHSALGMCVGREQFKHAAYALARHQMRWWRKSKGVQMQGSQLRERQRALCCCRVETWRRGLAGACPNRRRVKSRRRTVLLTTSAAALLASLHARRWPDRGWAYWAARGLR